MAYIGNSPANVGNYQVVDDISSTFNGVLTSFALTVLTLAINPAKSGQLLVSINGVLQEPDDTGTEGFKVSGSNIVFSSAPATGSTFWAVWQGQAVDIGTPSDGVVGTAQMSYPLANFTSTGIDDNATSTAITIDASENVGIGTTTPDSSLEIYKASTAELMIGSDNGGTAQISLYENNSTTKEATIKYDGSANNLVIGTSGQANAIVIPRDSGYVTMPNQPSFRAGVSMTDLPTGTTTLTLTEVYDVGGNLASNVFTAPVTGKYLLTYSLYLLDIDFATTNITIQINTSNKNYGNTFEPDEFMKDGDAAHSFTMSNVCDMDAGDTADFRIYYASGSLVLDVHSDSAVTGHLLG